MRRSIDVWRRLSAKKVAAGSEAQVVFCIADAAHDIDELFRENEKAAAELHAVQEGSDQWRERAEQAEARLADTKMDLERAQLQLLHLRQTHDLPVDKRVRHVFDVGLRYKMECRDAEARLAEVEAERDNLAMQNVALAVRCLDGANPISAEEEDAFIAAQATRYKAVVVAAKEETEMEKYAALRPSDIADAGLKKTRKARRTAVSALPMGRTHRWNKPRRTF